MILKDPEVELEYETLSDDPMANFIKFLRKKGNKTTERQYPKRLKYFFDAVWIPQMKDTTKSKYDEVEYEKFVTLEDVKIEDQAKEFLRYYDEKGEKWVKGAFSKMVKVHKKRVESGEIVEGTIFNYYKAGRRFCDANKIKVDDWSEVSTSVPTGRKASDDRAPNEEEIKQIVTYPDRRIKAIIYTMLSSGIRRSSWGYMKWKHIEPYYDENGKVLCAKLTAYNIKRKGKKDKWYYTFITPEAYTALLEYKQYREKQGEVVDGESWVMIHKDDPNKLLSPLGVKIIIERAAQKAKIFKPLKKGQKRREWQLTHGFRKYFKTMASEAMDHLIVEMCLDHDTGLAESYYKAQEPQRRANYLKAVPLLTIEEANKNIDKITAQLRNEMHQEVKSLRKEFLIYKFEQTTDSLQETIIRQYERNGKNQSPATPDMPKEFVTEALDWEKKHDANLTLDELAFVTVEQVLKRLEVNEADLRILNEYITEEFLDHGIFLYFGLPFIVAQQLGTTPDEIRSRWKK